MLRPIHADLAPRKVQFTDGIILLLPLFPRRPSDRQEADLFPPVPFFARDSHLYLIVVLNWFSSAVRLPTCKSRRILHCLKSPAHRVRQL